MPDYDPDSVVFDDYILTEHSYSKRALEFVQENKEECMSNVNENKHNDHTYAMSSTPSH